MEESATGPEKPDRGTVRVFGNFGLFDCHARPVPLAARSAAAVCALLAACWRGVSRTEVADTLWPKGDFEPSRAALRTAVYRVRAALGKDAVIDEDGRLRLTLRTDTQDAVRLRRRRQRAAGVEEAIDAGTAEWAIVRHELLAGWEDEWVAPLRDNGRILANDCGTALARLYEELGDREAALAALDGVLDAVPYHVEALEHAMRLEHALHGRERALARVADARATFSGHKVAALPASIRRLQHALSETVSGFVPPPQVLSDGADLAIVGHMLEGSLQGGGTAALAFLAEQALSPVCLRHPHRTLDLLRKALRLSDGFGPERCAVIVAAITMAINLPDNEATHELCDGLIAHFPPEHRLHNGALLMKGSACLNAMDLDRARDHIERAVEAATTTDRRLVAASLLGTIDAHETRFHDALARYLPAIAALEASTREDRWRNLASLQGRVCTVRLALGDVAGAAAAGEVARSVVAAGEVNEVLAAAPHGLALLLSGRRAEAVARLCYALRETHRAKLNTAFASAVEVAAIALNHLERPEAGRMVLEAADALRRSAGIPRSRGERFLIVRWGGPIEGTLSSGPLRLQSPGALVECVEEILERAIDPSPAP